MQVPWSENEDLDFVLVAKKYFGGGLDRKEWYDLAFNRALKPISTIGSEDVPDLLQFLPPPEAKDFPSKAIGLLALLDQGPRALFSGANERYSYGYFDQLTAKLARQLEALPAAQRPFSVSRLMEQGWSFDYAIAAVIWFMVPFVHSEHLEDQERQITISEEIRKAVEEHTGKIDPNRATIEEDSKDIYAFGRILVKETPKWEGTKLEDFVFWFLRLTRVHKPIIDKFGRYPYRNNSLGRISTPEEIQYLEDTDHFAMMEDEDAIKKIRQDVEAGIWSPLEDQAEFGGSAGGEAVTNTWEKLMSKN